MFDTDIQFDKGTDDSTERVLSDLSFLIAFSMMIIIFIIIPFATYVSSVLVKVPQVDIEASDAVIKDSVEINLYLTGSLDNLKIKIENDQDFIDVEFLLTRLKSKYAGKLKGKVNCRVYADENLLYKKIMEVIARLESLSETIDVDITLIYKNQGRG